MWRNIDIGSRISIFSLSDLAFPSDLQEPTGITLLYYLHTATYIGTHYDVNGYSIMVSLLLKDCNG